MKIERWNKVGPTGTASFAKSKSQVLEMDLSLFIYEEIKE